MTALLTLAAAERALESENGADGGPGTAAAGGRLRDSAGVGVFWDGDIWGKVLVRLREMGKGRYG